MEFSAFRLTIVGALVVIVLSAGLVVAFGGPQNAAPYLTLVGSIAIPAVLALARSEANAKKVDTVEERTEIRHAENLSAIDELRRELAATNGGKEN